MTTKLYVADQQTGYIFMDGKLRAYQFISAWLDFEEGEIKYTCKVGGTEHDFTTDEPVRIYKDEDAYKAGNHLDNKAVSWRTAMNAGLHLCAGSRANETGECSVFTIVRNEIEEVSAPVDGYIYSNGDITHPLEGEFFTTREDAMLHLDVIKVDENGVETLIESPARKVALTAEQTEVLNEVVSILAKAYNAGIRFVIDNCSENLYAYNTNNVAERTFDCCRDAICEWGYDITELMQTVVGRYDIVPLSMDDCRTYVKFKE